MAGDGLHQVLEDPFLCYNLMPVEDASWVGQGLPFCHDVGPLVVEARIMLSQSGHGSARASSSI